MSTPPNGSAAQTSIAMRPFTASLPMALLAARENTMTAFRPVLAEHDITEQQWRVLRALSSSTDPFEAGPLARVTSLLAPSLSRILNHLSDRGLIERTTASHDQRRSLVSLTPAGLQLVATVAPFSEQTYTLIEERFGTDRLTRLLDELHDLASLNLTEHTA